MPSSENAEKKLIKLPWSEAAVYFGIQGKELVVTEEDLYMNGNVIPENERAGCYAAGHVMTKTEAGWKE